MAASKAVPGYYKGMPKKEREIREFFSEQAMELLTKVFGLPPASLEAANDLMGPHATFVAMTDAGKLTLQVRDDEVTTQFALPAAAKHVVGCNPHSGKWNHHAFVSRRAHGKEAEQRWTGDYVQAVLNGLYHGLEALDARPWSTTATSMTVAEGEAQGREELNRRTHMGEVISFTDWDRAAALAFYEAHVTDVAGNRPDWLLQDLGLYYGPMPDSELYFRLRDWRARVEAKIEA